MRIVLPTAPFTGHRSGSSGPGGIHLSLRRRQRHGPLMRFKGTIDEGVATRRQPQRRPQYFSGPLPGSKNRRYMRHHATIPLVKLNPSVPYKPIPKAILWQS